MNTADSFAGVIPAAVTPLAAGETLAAASLKSLLQRFWEAGASGAYLCGQTGEGLSLPASVRKQVVETALACTPPEKHLIVHVGAARTADALDLARHASRCGAHAVSSLPPGSAYSFSEVRSYYESLAAAVEIPLLVYYFPEFSRSVSTLEQILELCAIPNVIGLKFTDFDLYRLSLIRRSGAVIFNGRDEVFAAGLLMGACGGIGSFYNLVPELFVQVFDHAKTGNWGLARAIQDRINDLIRVVLSFPALAAQKRLLTWSGIDCGCPVRPRRALTAEEESRLKTELRMIRFDPSGFLAR